MSELNWYEYDQNNSGGRFESDDKICHRVYIQAKSDFDSLVIAEDLGIYLDGCSDGLDCPCCGDRWGEADKLTFPKKFNGSTTFKSVEEYATFLAKKYTAIVIKNAMLVKIDFFVGTSRDLSDKISTA